MKTLKLLIAIVLCGNLLLPLPAMAIELIFKDNQGRYHYRCTDKTGGITIVVYRAEGVYVDGPTGQNFYPMETAPIVRSEDYIKFTEKFARLGCRERREK